MCNQSCINFGMSALKFDDIQGKDVLEVGSFNENGSLRDYLLNLHPAKYLGVDICSGPGVDVLCDARKLIRYFGRQSFDVVISTEAIEHIRDWRTAISNIKGVVRKGGVLVITTRSIGFGYHAYPNDYWRYEIEDIRTVLADFKIVMLESDPSEPGVFLKAQFFDDALEPPDLREHKLFSIVTNRRQTDISNLELGAFLSLRWLVIKIFPILPRAIQAHVRYLMTRWRKSGTP